MEEWHIRTVIELMSQKAIWWRLQADLIKQSEQDSTARTQKIEVRRAQADTWDEAAALLKKNAGLLK